jgi:hypothetical protein
MACDKALTYTFAVHELYPDGSEDSSYKVFSVSKAESDAMMRKFGYYCTPDVIDDYGILLTMFDKLFGFTIGPNGFSLTWDLGKRHISGSIGWPGPRPPAIRCGGAWWKLRRIV